MQGLLVKSLSVKIHGVPILDHIDLKVKPGEALGILGSSGCGKTSLLRAIFGLLDRSYVGRKSEIFLDDCSLIPFPKELRRCMQIVFQDFENVVLQHEKVVNILWDVISLNEITSNGSSKGCEKLKYFLGDFLRLNPWEWKKETRELSGGKKQVLALAQALARLDPKRNESAVIALDEMSSSCDPFMETRLFKKFADKNIFSFNPALLVVTHNIKRFADYFPDGRMIFLESCEKSDRGSAINCEISCKDFKECKCLTPYAQKFWKATFGERATSQADSGKRRQ
jgi:ABC-type glutathione transport system ATPase component